MTWEDLGAIGDLVGGVAVVVSLVYVAFQIRQNSRQIEQNSRHMAAPYLAALLFRPFVRDWWKRQGPGTLTPEFRQVVDALVAQTGAVPSRGS